MQLVRDAAEAVQRNLSSFALYMGVLIAANAVPTLVSLPLRSSDPSSASLTLQLLDVALLIVMIHVFALAQAVVFSRLGREIDRPLWKVRDDREALRRFFVLWAVVNLVLYGILHLANVDYGNGEMHSINYVLALATLAVALCAVPFGACMMFTGSARFRLLGESLAPLAKQPGKTAVVIGITLFQFLLFIVFSQAAVGGEGQETPILKELLIASASAVVQAYLDCLAFAATWLLCMTDRDTVDEIDLDF
ncbi:MAG: hypothetical protein IT365_17335 [Candidatus Hydrogenedentes bacterium]|nr:hypothetical protein [Candidatus Hydrogenedentota bacterium]